MTECEAQVTNAAGALAVVSCSVYISLLYQLHLPVDINSHSLVTKCSSSHNTLVASQSFLLHGMRSPTQALRSTRGMDSLAQITLWFTKEA